MLERRAMLLKKTKERDRKEIDRQTDRCRIQPRSGKRAYASGEEQVIGINESST